MRNAPAKPVRACTLRNWCLVSHVTFEAPLRSSRFTLHTSHSVSTTKTCKNHFPVLLCTTQLAQNTFQYDYVLHAVLLCCKTFEKRVAVPQLLARNLYFPILPARVFALATSSSQEQGTSCNASIVQYFRHVCDFLFPSINILSKSCTAEASMSRFPSRHMTAAAQKHPVPPWLQDVSVRRPHCCAQKLRAARSQVRAALPRNLLTHELYSFGEPNQEMS